MALPKREQPLARFIAFHNLTQEQFAEALSDSTLGIEVTLNEVRGLVRGARYPSPRELDRISAIFQGLPVEVFFDREMLRYRHVTSWPPKGKGFRPNRSA